MNLLHGRIKTCKQGIHPGFETQGGRHQKFKTGVLVAPQKGLMSSKKKAELVHKLFPQSISGPTKRANVLRKKGRTGPQIISSEY